MYTAIPSVQRISCKLHEAPNKQMHPSATRLVLTEWGHLCCYYEAFDRWRIESNGRWSSYSFQPLGCACDHIAVAGSLAGAYHHHTFW